MKRPEANVKEALGTAERREEERTGQTVVEFGKDP